MNVFDYWDCRNYKIGFILLLVFVSVYQLLATLLIFCPCQGNQVQMQVDAHLMGEVIFHKSVQLQKDSLPSLPLLANQERFPSSGVNDSTGWQQ